MATTRSKSQTRKSALGETLDSRKSARLRRGQKQTASDSPTPEVKPAGTVKRETSSSVASGGKALPGLPARKGSGVGEAVSACEAEPERGLKLTDVKARQCAPAAMSSDDEDNVIATSSETKIKSDHGYSGAPPLFRKSPGAKHITMLSPDLSALDERWKDIQTMLGTQRSALIMCPRECRVGSCTDVHHPLLVALLNCRDVSDKEEMRKRLINLLTVIKKYATTLTIEENKRWKLCDPIPDCVERYRIPMLHWAATIGAVKAIEWLLGTSSEHDVMGKDRNGKGVLHRAIHALQENYDVDTASEKFAGMLRHLEGALYVQDKNGDTPLHLCATFLVNDFPNPAFFRSCILSIIQRISEMEGEGMLVELIGKQNKNGNTCLHALFGSVKTMDVAKCIVQALSQCKFHASAYRPNNKGDTPIHVAMRCKCRSLLEEVTWCSPEVITIFTETSIPDGDRTLSLPVSFLMTPSEVASESLSPDAAYLMIKQRTCFGERLQTVSEMPRKPRPGSVFLYLPDRKRKEDAGLFTDSCWFSRSEASREEIARFSLDNDGLRWVQFKMLLLPKISKQYYLVRAGTDVSGDFRKEVWSVVDDKRYQARLVHYVGDQSAASSAQEEKLQEKVIPKTESGKRKTPTQGSEGHSKSKKRKLPVSKRAVDSDVDRLSGHAEQTSETDGSSDTEIVWPSGQEEIEQIVDGCGDSVSVPASGSNSVNPSPARDTNNSSLGREDSTGSAHTAQTIHLAGASGQYDVTETVFEVADEDADLDRFDPYATLDDASFELDNSQDDQSMESSQEIQVDVEEIQDSTEEDSRQGASRDQSEDDVFITFVGDSITLEGKEQGRSMSSKLLSDGQNASDNGGSRGGIGAEVLVEALEHTIAKLSGVTKASEDISQSVPNSLKIQIPSVSSSDEVTSEFMQYVNTCSAKERQDVVDTLNAEVTQCAKSLKSVDHFSEALTSRYDSLQQHQVKLVLEVQRLLQRKMELQKENRSLYDGILETESELSNSKGMLVGLKERLAHCTAALDVLRDISTPSGRVNPS